MMPDADELNDADVYRIRGVPGAGKTTEILQRTEELLDDGYELTDFRWISFTNSHARDLVTDLCGGDGPFTPDDFDAVAERVTTLHSLVKSLNGVNGDDIVTGAGDDDTIREFFTDRGIRFQPAGDPLRKAEEDESREMSEGEKLLAIDQWLMQHGDTIEASLVELTPEWIDEAPVDTTYAGSEVAAILAEYRAWKDEQGIYEHHDYICEYATKLHEEPEYARWPDCSVLFIDEFQDYAPAEYLILREWMDADQYDLAVIAGDENQSIYSFKGAKPWLFDETPADVENVRRQSYRCPEAVTRVARGILPDSGITSALDDEGVAREKSLWTDVEAAELALSLLDRHDADDGGDVYLLARTNRHAKSIARALRKQGVPFSGIGTKFAPAYADPEETHPWTDRWIAVAELLRGMAAGTDVLDYEDAYQLIDAAVASDRRWEQCDAEYAGPPADVEDAPDVPIWTAFPGCSDIADIAQKLEIGGWRKKMVLTAAESPDVDIREAAENIKIGTIHAAKGRQAPAVVTFAGYPANLAEKWWDDDEFRAEERRLYYVAATRASEELVIAREFFDGRQMPLFRDGLPHSTSNSPNTQHAD